MEIDEQEVAVTEVASDMKLQAHPMNGILGRCWKNWQKIFLWTWKNDWKDAEWIEKELTYTHICSLQRSFFKFFLMLACNAEDSWTCDNVAVSVHGKWKKNLHSATQAMQQQAPNHTLQLIQLKLVVALTAKRTIINVILLQATHKKVNARSVEGVRACGSGRAEAKARANA